MEEEVTTELINVWLDMETGDPDDCITLLFLLNHRRVALRGVSVYPGDKHQVGFVKGLIAKYGTWESVPVGSYNSNDEKMHLGPSNVKLFGQDLNWTPQEPDDEAHRLIAKYLVQYPNGTMITGGPLGNLYVFLKENPHLQMEKIFVQGGFAGANCVPTEHQLAKFKGKTTCPTFNFGGHVKGANALLTTNQIQKKHLISKDVCHGVYWDRNFHKIALHFKGNSSAEWKLLLSAMDSYLGKKSDGKMLHDPLAACTCIDPSIITFCEVIVSRDKKGHWGSNPTPGTNTWISIGVDKIKFYSVFLDVDEQKIIEFMNK